MKVFRGLKRSLLQDLVAWFAVRARVLPWRSEPSWYRVWVSEIMLQQTQVITVLPYFDRFMARFPTVEVLAAASEDEVVAAWAGLGYYSRARNLRLAAQQVVAQGAFSSDRSGWECLPGVGPYTAGAILSIAGNQCEAIVDGNVERVVARVLRLNRRGGDTVYKARLWLWARAAVRKGVALNLAPRDLNQALMELGATVCTPRSPKCSVCPIAHACRGFFLEDAESFPPAKARKEWVVVRERCLAVIRKQAGRWQVLVRKRQKGEWRAGLWDFLELPSSHEECTRLGLSALRTVRTKHVVTRHKIERETRVVDVGAGDFTTAFKEWMTQLQQQSQVEWQYADEVAGGSAFVKTWRGIEDDLKRSEP